MMSRIRSKDTSVELAVRSFFHSKGFRFRIHKKDLPGKPDITLPKYKAVIFVQGCFWHQHPGCQDFGIPRSNRSYWRKKLAGNVARDKSHQQELTLLGWRVFVIWECEVGVERLERLASEIHGAPVEQGNPHLMLKRIRGAGHRE